MTKNEWELLLKDAMNALRQQPFFPEESGNMKDPGLKGIWTSNITFTIYIDEGVAPYVFFTNEKWIKRPGINPNEGWINKAHKFLADYIQARLKG